MALRTMNVLNAGRLRKQAKLPDWSSDGQSHVVYSKDITLSRKIGASRFHITPEVEVSKSTIARAGKGLKVRQEVVRKEMIIAEYNGPLVWIDEARDLDARVCSAPLYSS